MQEIIIFDRKIKRLHRDRSAKLLDNHDFLLKAAAQHLMQHLEDITREFPMALELGSRNGMLPELLLALPNIKNIIATDSSLKMLLTNKNMSLIADEEFIPFAENSFDLVLSLLNLHWVNDLPGTLIQIRQILKENGLFIASMFGGETLIELRQAMMSAEMDVGISPRISPFTDIKSAAGLLQRAGFSMPVADSEKFTVLYSDPLQLMHDLRGMAETNALVKRRKNFTGRKVIAAITDKYREMFGNDDGLIPATFEIITITGTG